MKKTILITMSVTAMIFTSCGGGNKDADMQTVCDCFAKGGDTQGCVDKWDEIKKNYSQNERQEMWLKISQGCK